MAAFAFAALVLIMMPGPDQALITRSTLVGGRRTGMLTALGGMLGLAGHAIAAAVGLSAVLLASATAFTVLKFIGAAYLLWLGLRALCGRRRAGSVTPGATDRATGIRPVAAVGQGWLSNASNPKVSLFFLTFLPQFIPAGAAPGGARGHALLLSAVFGLLYITWFALYVAALNHLGKVLRRPRVTASVERVTGLILVGFAARLLAARPAA